MQNFYFVNLVLISRHFLCPRMCFIAPQKTTNRERLELRPMQTPVGS